jgi:hypothetical protein
VNLFQEIVTKLYGYRLLIGLTLKEFYEFCGFSEKIKESADLMTKKNRSL